MGIRFRCPNGHKLNVKSFLAGKKGVCPRCGARFRIPEPPQNDFDFDVVSAIDGETESAPAPLVTVEHLQSTRKPSTPTTQRANDDDVVIAEMVDEASPSAIGGQSSAMAAAPQPVAGATRDPLAENPTANWYVRPPAGGQYGPAQGDVFRRWLSEGRVTDDSLVWCEGWPQWRAASEVFPELRPRQFPGVYAAPTPAPSPTASLAPTATPKPAAAPTQQQPGTPRPPTKGGGNTTAMVTVGFLFLAGMGMLAVFVLLVLRAA